MGSRAGADTLRFQTRAFRIGHYGGPYFTIPLGDMTYNVRYSTGYLYEGKDMDYAYSIPLGIMIGGSAVVFSVKNEGENDLTLTGSPFVDLTGDDVFSIAAQPVGYVVKLSPGGDGIFQCLARRGRKLRFGWTIQLRRKRRRPTESRRVQRRQCNRLSRNGRRVSCKTYIHWRGSG
jgi:hypothetical protein